MRKEKEKKTEKTLERKRYRDKENPLYPPLKESLFINILLSIVIMATCILLAGAVVYYSYPFVHSL